MTWHCHVLCYLKKNGKFCSFSLFYSPCVFKNLNFILREILKKEKSIALSFVDKIKLMKFHWLSKLERQLFREKNSLPNTFRSQVVSSSRVKLSTFLARGLVGQNVEISVVDPNTLNFDPDPEFWPNLNPDPYPDLGLCYQF